MELEIKTRMSNQPHPEEKWIQWVALTAIFLAIAASIISLEATLYNTKVQLLASEENSQWAYYQSKSIKEHIFTLNKDLLQLENLKDQNSQSRIFLQSKLKEYDSEIPRYEKEKTNLKNQAENLLQEEKIAEHHGENFHLAIMFFQVGIMLSSMSVLLKNKILWLLGILFGVFAFIFVANGFYLFF